MKREVAAVIPPEDTVGMEQKQESSLLGCSDGGHLWTGLTIVNLVPGADGPGCVQKIKEVWTGEEGWQVTQRTTAEGRDVVDILNDAGYTHGVAYWESVGSRAGCHQRKALTCDDAWAQITEILNFVTLSYGRPETLETLSRIRGVHRALSRAGYTGI